MNDPAARVNPLRSMPNLLTLGRICLMPFLVSAILEDHYRLGFALFVVAGLTDALDGALARILKQGTMLGQYLDPVADKLLLSTLFVVLTVKGLVALRITVLVFGRDLGILIVAALLYAAVGRRDFRPTLVGKANTAAQVLAVTLVLLHQVFARCWVLAAGRWALDATVVLTIASGLQYTWLVARNLAAPSGARAGGHK